jgi:hypothetical protein
VPEYEPVGRRGLATSNADIPEYEPVATRRQQSQPSTVVKTNNPIPQYEIVDNQRHIINQGAEPNRITEQRERVPQQLPTNIPSLYQSIQPQSGNYRSLSPMTRLPPKNTLLSNQNQSGEYQALQEKGVSSQYQSLDDLTRC